MTPHVGRHTLPHHTPSWVDPDASEYFITICCGPRGTAQLTLPDVAPALLASARFYHEQRKWYPSPLLLMPDHLHMIVSFGRGNDMTKVIEAWKRYAATKFRVKWQRGFFEHRLRSRESAEAKFQYILDNPVRKGLVEEASTWPHVLRLE